MSLEETIEMSPEEFSLPKNAFHGKRRRSDQSRLQVKIQRLDEMAEKFSEKSLPVNWKTGMLGLPDVWKLFRRRSEALEFAKKFGKSVMVFSKEEKVPGSTGQRLYLVTHPKYMWKQHVELSPAKRCAYEVITEGAACKLYFNLEYLKEFNPNHDGDQMVDIFIKCILWFLEFQYRIVESRENILDLEASTAKKFSRHLIFQSQNFVFKDNIQAGNFVRTLCLIIRCCIDSTSLEFSSEKQHKYIADNVKNLTQHVSANDLEQLMILDKNSTRTLFCDEGVYTKNKNFRLYLSTKFGHNAPLLTSAKNRFIPEVKSSVEREAGTLSIGESQFFFLNSLITYTSFTDHLRILEFTSEYQEKSFFHPCKSSVSSESVSGSNKSPYPEIDNFIQEIITRDVNGYIRRWSYFPQSKLLIYDIVNYRYCDNIKRHHRSNNIMFLVKLDQGTYYQKCHDPECRKNNFKSQELPLPSSILSLNSCPSSRCDVEGERNPLDETCDDDELSSVVAAIETKIGFGSVNTL